MCELHVLFHGIAKTESLEGRELLPSRDTPVVGVEERPSHSRHSNLHAPCDPLIAVRLLQRYYQLLPLGLQGVQSTARRR